MSDPDFRTNRLIAALPTGEYAALAPNLTPIRLDTGAEIYAPGAPIRDAYFPLTGVTSTLVTMANGAMIETGTIGNEGFVGLAGFHGGDGGPLTTVAQVPGSTRACRSRGCARRPRPAVRSPGSSIASVRPSTCWRRSPRPAIASIRSKSVAPAGSS